MISVTYYSPRTSRRARRKDLLKCDIRYNEVYVNFSPIYGYYTCSLRCSPRGYLLIHSTHRSELIDKIHAIYNNIDILHLPIKFIF